MICLMVKMGGSGVRFGSDIPKQYVEINNHPLFYWLLDEYRKLDLIDKYILVSNPDWIDYTKIIAEELIGDKLLGVVPGGATMSNSIYNGVTFARRYLADDDILLIHDVTNPIIAKKEIPDVIKAAEERGFSVLTTEQVHTIYHIDNENNIEYVIPRQEVSSGYSPEGFIFKKIYDCYKKATSEQLDKMTSAIALAKQYDAKPAAVKSHIVNLKITYSEDLEVFRKIIKE